MPTVTACAPGRVELLGNHTDYNRGFVLGAAIDRRVEVSAKARHDQRVIFQSVGFPGRAEAELALLTPLKENRWANYALGVLQQFLAAGFTLHGFEMEIFGNLPVGAGLSSSAAFEVATAYALIGLHDLELEPMAIARLCRKAENEFVGVQSGLLDQATSVFGGANEVVLIDCDTEQIRTIPFPSELALVIADSGTAHRLDAGDYNTRREECAAAARALQVDSLREVTLKQLEDKSAMLEPLLYRRALHVIAENERVQRAVAAMQAGDAASIGNLMNGSHESSRTNFENSTPELDALVVLARALPGVLGSRLTGGGFGGGTVTLVEASEAERVAQQINQRWHDCCGKDAAAFVCRIADGAAVMNTPAR